MGSILVDEYRLVIDALNKAGVSFMLIGGVAVIAHGYARTTGDMDLWIKPDNGQKPLLKAALTSVGYDPDDLSAIDEFDFEQAFVFSIGVTPEKIDFFTKVNLVTFEEAYPKREMIEVDGIVMPIICLQDLVLTKFNTGRPQDAADISRLQDIAKYRNKEGGVS